VIGVTARGERVKDALYGGDARAGEEDDAGVRELDGLRDAVSDDRVARVRAFAVRHKGGERDLEAVDDGRVRDRVGGEVAVVVVGYDDGARRVPEGPQELRDGRRHGRAQQAHARRAFGLADGREVGER